MSVLARIDKHYIEEVAMCIVRLTTDRQRLTIYMEDAKKLRDRSLNLKKQGFSIYECSKAIIKEFC